MQEELKKQMRKSTVLRILLCAAIILLSFAIAGDSLKKLIEKPKELDSLAVEELPGSYVTGSINAIIGNFAEYYVTKDDGTENITSRYYIIPVGEYEFIGLEAAKDDYAIADQIYYDTMDYLNGDIVDLTRVLSTKGTVNAMSDEVISYYYDWFQDFGYTDEEIQDYALPYMLQIDYIGEYHDMTVYIFCVIMGLGILMLLLSIIQFLAGTHLSKIKKFQKQNADRYSLEQIEEDFENAAVFRHIRIGKLFTIYFQGGKAWILKNQDIIWAYEQQITHRTYGIKVNTSKNLLLYTKAKKKYVIQLKKKDDLSGILQQLSRNQSSVIIGYSDKLMKCYKKEFDTFLNLGSENGTESTETIINN